MYKVRIKKACGGTHKKMQDGGYSDESMEANSYMGPVDREDANIEVEKGESAFGDINGDSFAELMFFGGKRHHSGGTPVNVPPGTFIFSDTPKLRIKDSELLEKFFNIKNPRKKGYTPAEISKQYKDFNKHMETIKDSTSDELAVGTAYEMINGIKDKLGALALIQESMKGFPDGIPSFAESAIAGLGMDPQELVQKMMPQEQQEAPMGEMKYGGLPTGYYEHGGSHPPKKPKIEWYSKDYKGQYKGQGFDGSKANYIDFINDLAGVDKKGNQTSSGTTMKVDGEDYTLTRQDAENLWKLYLDAWETGDTKKINKVKTVFESLDAPGIGAWPWGTQDTLQNLAGILDERVTYLDNAEKKQKRYDKAKLAKDDYARYLNLLKHKYTLMELENPNNPNITQVKAKISAVEKKLEQPVYRQKKESTSAGWGAVATKISDVYFDTDVLKKDYSTDYEALVNEINELEAPGYNLKIAASNKTIDKNDLNDYFFFDQIKIGEPGEKELYQRHLDMMNMKLNLPSQSNEPEEFESEEAFLEWVKTQK